MGGWKNRSKQRGKEKEELKSPWCWDAGFVSAEEGAFAESGSGYSGDKAAEFSLWRSWDRDKVALPPLRSEGSPIPGQPSCAACWEHLQQLGKASKARCKHPQARGQLVVGAVPTLGHRSRNFGRVCPGDVGLERGMATGLGHQAEPPWG